MASSFVDHIDYIIYVSIIFVYMSQVIYINGRPFVLRDVEQPFSNLEYTVCNATQILPL